MKNSEHRHKDIRVYILSFKGAFRGQTKVEDIHDAEFQLELTEDEDTDKVDPEAVDKDDVVSGSSGDGMTSVVQLKQQEDFEELEGADPETDD